MRRFLAYCLGALLALAPVEAVAAITQITGTGTGGSIVNITGQFSGSSVALVTTATIPSNSLVVVLVNNCGNGTVTSFSVSDTHSNTYTAPRAIDQSNGAAEQIFYSYTGNQINSGDTITASVSGVANCLTGQVLAFAGTSSTPFDVAAGASNSGASGTLTVGPTATLACPTGAAGCEVLIGGEVLHTAGTVTNDSNFTATATFGAGINWISGFWIVGATTARSYAPSTNTATNWGGQLLAFKAATGGAVVCKRSLMGVGC